MKLPKDSRDHYYLRIGAVYVGGKVKAQRFGLGTHYLTAVDKAERIRAIWETQDGVWTPEGISEARKVALEGPKRPGQYR